MASCTRRLWKKKSGATNSASARSREIAAKAASISPLLLALRTCIFRPKASAACCTSRTVISALTTLVDHHGDANRSRHEIAQQPQSLWHRLADEEVDAGRVATWAREVGDQTKLDRIIADAENDWDRP